VAVADGIAIQRATEVDVYLAMFFPPYQIVD
jgi:hypothetical protein